MVQSDLQRSTQEYREVAKKLAEAKVNFATAFLLNKMRKEGTTDRVADMMAIVDTNDEVTILTAELVIAKKRFENASEST